MFTGTRGEGRGGRGRQRTRNDKGGGGGSLQKNFFRAFGASVWTQNKGEPGPPGPIPWIRHW